MPERRRRFSAQFKAEAVQLVIEADPADDASTRSVEHECACEALRGQG